MNIRPRPSWRATVSLCPEAKLPARWTKPKRRRRSSAAAWWSKRRSTRADAAKAAASRSPRTPRKPRAIAEKILGMTLITHQTGPEGRVVQRLLIEETLPIERELYLGIVLDRAHRQERVHGVGRRRRGDRRGRREDAGADLERADRARASGSRRFRRASWRSASALPGPLGEPGGRRR